MTATLFDPTAMARHVAEIGTEVNPTTAQASYALFAPFHETEPYEAVTVQRDEAYGTHPRQLLDVFAPGGDGLPVVMFVHGGGFVGGDKRQGDGSPYHDNVALWAARNGFVGVTMTHRLAPEFPWPAGAEDVASAVDWLRDNIAVHGGDPQRIHLMGTSAGAMHVATYLAHSRFHPPGGLDVRSASLLSGAYDLPSFDPAILAPYFGDDVSRYAEYSPLPGLVDSPVPVFYAVGEHDADASQRQALTLVNAYYEAHGRLPAMLRLPGHNHFTVTAHLNTPDDTLSPHLLRHINR